MSKYLQAGELFRQREQVAHQDLQVNRQFHNGDTATKDALAPELSTISAETLRIGRELHSLGFSVRVENAGNWSEYQLREGGEIVSSFEIQK